MISRPLFSHTPVRAGVIANPQAGLGPDVVRATIKSIVNAVTQALSTWRIVVLRDGFSAHATAASDTPIESVASPATATDSGHSAEILLAAGVDVLIGVGGDGTLADIAAAIVRDGRCVPLLGVGVGSSNVGPLVSVCGQGMSAVDFGSLESGGVHGVEVFRSKSSLGIAFNDVVFGNLYFGTREGKRVDLDAAAHLRGDDRPTKPWSVCLETTYVKKNGRAVLDGKRHRLAQIVASPLNESRVYAGKVASGLMSWGPYLGRPAVIAGISEVAIRTVVDDELLARVEPLSLYHVCFGPDDTIEVGGLDRAAVVVLDGNPVWHVELGESIALKLRPDVLHVLRTTGSRSWEASKLPEPCGDGSAQAEERSRG